jgi:hypothetical protein
MMSDTFVQPAVEVGDMVHWYHGRSHADLGSQDPVLAFVTKVCPHGLELARLPKDHGGFQLSDSACRHMDDPATKRLAESDPDEGFWVLPPKHLTAGEVRGIRQLLEDFGSGAAKKQK